jgi:hypothetical protein
MKVPAGEPRVEPPDCRGLDPNEIDFSSLGTKRRDIRECVAAMAGLNGAVDRQARSVTREDEPSVSSIGFSCREKGYLLWSGNRRGHLARIYAQAMTGNSSNPFPEWTTAFDVPPSRSSRGHHHLQKEGILRERSEVESIATSADSPSFANTVEALDRAGEFLSRVMSVFSNLYSAETNEQLQAINREVAPMLSSLHDDIRLNPALVIRIKTLWEQRSSLPLKPEQQRLLEDLSQLCARWRQPGPALKRGSRKVRTLVLS